LYTSQKLKKRKAWSDGVLKLNAVTNSCLLYSLNTNYDDIYNSSANKTSLLEMCNKLLEQKQLTADFEISGLLSGSITGIEFENYLVDEIEVASLVEDGAACTTPADSRSAAPQIVPKPVPNTSRSTGSGIAPLKKFKVPATVASKQLSIPLIPNQSTGNSEATALDRIQVLVSRPVRNIDYGNTINSLGLGSSESGDLVSSSGSAVPFDRNSVHSRDAHRSSAFAAPKKYSFVESELDDIWGDGGGDGGGAAVNNTGHHYSGNSKNSGDNEPWGDGEENLGHPHPASNNPQYDPAPVVQEDIRQYGGHYGGDSCPSLAAPVAPEDATEAVSVVQREQVGQGGGDGAADWDNFDPDNFTVQTI